ncbi:MAG: bifunctional 4-hydroxy-2-oxoglutarate aldolase/2-dehydro-3-deoxy-phosphogluconate aldolase [Candidatus Acidiferrales bacterium]
MKREEVRNRIEEIGIVAAIRVDSGENALFAAEAVHQGGIPIVEIALTVPGATEVISHLVQQNSQLIVGAGSVLNAQMAQTCLDAGAQFLTSDGLHLALVEFAARKGVVVFPGALTPTEVITAWESGCDFVKVVPCAHIGGESYIRSVHRMFPHIPLIAAGGVNQETASRYILAGAAALGIGSELIPAEAIQRRQADRIRELTHRFAGFVKSAREGKPPQREGTYIG